MTSDSTVADDKPVVRRLTQGAAEDWRAVRDLCCRTGFNGAPIAHERRSFFAENWIGPYEKLYPQWTYVADAAGTVVGYLTGTSRAARRARLLTWQLRLAYRIWKNEYPKNKDTEQFVRRLLGSERAPEDRFPKKTRELLARGYPAHLHMNVDAACRGMGVGKLLAERFFEDLRGESVPGVHLFCGPDPKPFYERIGFSELGRLEGERVVHLMGRGLN